MPMRDLMTPKQVAGYPHLNVEAVDRLIREKKLVASRIGHSYRISRGDLKAFLRAHSVSRAVREALFRRVMSS